MTSLVLEIIFWASGLGLVHTYVLYPLILAVLAKGKSNNTSFFTKEEEWPLVSVLMSVYNEERVIKEKLESLQNLDYPEGKLKVYIGSDCSSDKTNDILSQYAKEWNSLYFFPFTERGGKPGVINRLVDLVAKEDSLTNDHIFLLTDASVMLQADTLRNLVRHFKREDLVLVDANMQSTGTKNEGISKSENQYVSNEVMNKNREGILWGKMIGPFGGCYVIRSSYFSKVPDNFLVDDFYIAFKAFEKGGNATNDLEAICYEAVSDDMNEEYRRKRRISSGNFQNLRTFRHLLWPPFSPLAFAFLSHKVLRWLGPFFLIFTFTISAYLSYQGNIIYQILFCIQIVLWGIVPLLDLILNKININFGFLRNIRYFIYMNIALLHGFIKYLSGIKNNVWQPTKRI